MWRSGIIPTALSMLRAIMFYGYATLLRQIPMLPTCGELEERNITGEILITNYLNFREPKALKK